MVSTHLKNISQIGNLPQLGVRIKNIWNHHLYKVYMGLITKGTHHFLLWQTQPFPSLGAHLDSIETDELEVFHGEITLDQADQRGSDPWNDGRYINLLFPSKIK